MDRHFTVTIHDGDGIKQFNLHNFIKKAVLYAILFMALLIFGSIGTVLYLKNAMKEVEIKTKNMQIAYDKLIEKNEALKEQMKQTQKALEDKKDELNEVANSLSEIETMIGLSPASDLPLKERVNIAKLNSEDIALMFQLIPSGSPIEYSGITSKFGYRIHPMLNKREFHPGIDMKAKSGTPVHATADGIVEWAGYHRSSGYGNLIILLHNYGFKSYFGHLKKIVIKPGEFIKKGQIIGYTGNSGLSNGPHLHYEIRFLSRVINPFWLVKWNIKNYKEIFEKEKKIPWQSLVTAITRIRMLKQIQTQPSSQVEHQSKEK